LTAKQEKFAAGVAAGLSQAQAYREAFASCKKWKDKTIHEFASRLAADSKVKARINELLAQAAKANEVTIERIVEEAVKIAFANTRDLVSWGPKGVVIRASDELTSDQAAAVSEVSASHGPAGQIKIKAHDKLGALRFLAEITGNLVKKHELTGKDGKPLNDGAKGVLVVPAVMSEDDWEKMMKQQQEGEA
jgi:phage terminase small subunit